MNRGNNYANVHLKKGFQNQATESISQMKAEQSGCFLKVHQWGGKVSHKQSYTFRAVCRLYRGKTNKMA